MTRSSLETCRARRLPPAYSPRLSLILASSLSTSYSPYPSASGFPSTPSTSPTIPPAAPIPSRFPYPPQPPQPVIMTLDNTSIPFNVSEHYEVLEMIGEGAYGVVV